MDSTSDPEPLAASVAVSTPEVGIIVLDSDRREVVLCLIGAEVPLPCTTERQFGFAYDGMTAVRFELTAGPGLRREDVLVVGKLEMTGLPRRQRRDPVLLSVTRTSTSIRAVFTDGISGRTATLRVDTTPIGQASR